MKKDGFRSSSPAANRQSFYGATNMTAEPGVGNWRLEFTGEAYDVENKLPGGGTNVRQQGRGTLSIIQTNADGTETVIDTYEAISGGGGNGLLPDGDYIGTDLIVPANFRDETGLSYKLILEWDPKQGLIQRGLFRVHPTPKYTSGSKSAGTYRENILPNDGCISPVGHEANKRFLEKMKEYYKKNKKIKVKVKVKNNANVKTQLKDQKYYNEDAKKRYEKKP